MSKVTITVDREELFQALAFGAGDPKSRAAQKIWNEVPPLDGPDSAIKNVLQCGDSFAMDVVRKLEEDGWRLISYETEDTCGCNGEIHEEHDTSCSCPNCPYPERCKEPR